MKLFVCTGKHCRKKKDGIEDVARAVDTSVELVRVRCQKICKGPVVGLKQNGSLEWFKDVDSSKTLSALKDAVRGQPLQKPLRNRHVPKRSGALRT